MFSGEVALAAWQSGFCCIPVQRLTLSFLPMLVTSLLTCVFLAAQCMAEVGQPDSCKAYGLWQLDKFRLALDQHGDL